MMNHGGCLTSITLSVSLLIAAAPASHAAVAPEPCSAAIVSGAVPEPPAVRVQDAASAAAIQKRLEELGQRLQAALPAAMQSGDMSEVQAIQKELQELQRQMLAAAAGGGQPVAGPGTPPPGGATGSEFDVWEPLTNEIDVMVTVDQTTHRQLSGVYGAGGAPVRYERESLGYSTRTRQGGTLRADDACELWLLLTPWTGRMWNDCDGCGSTITSFGGSARDPDFDSKGNITFRSTPFRAGDVSGALPLKAGNVDMGPGGVVPTGGVSVEYVGASVLVVHDIQGRTSVSSGQWYDLPEFRWGPEQAWFLDGRDVAAIMAGGSVTKTAQWVATDPEGMGGLSATIIITVAFADEPRVKRLTLERERRDLDCPLPAPDGIGSAPGPGERDGGRDQAHTRLVARADIAPPRAGETVHFVLHSLDDPSPDLAAGARRLEGPLSRSARTDAQGRATAAFALPGDVGGRVAAAASTDEAEARGVRVRGQALVDGRDRGLDTRDVTGSRALVLQPRERWLVVIDDCVKTFFDHPTTPAAGIRARSGVRFALRTDICLLTEGEGRQRRVVASRGRRSLVSVDPWTEPSGLITSEVVDGVVDPGPTSDPDLNTTAPAWSKLKVASGHAQSTPAITGVRELDLAGAHFDPADGLVKAILPFGEALAFTRQGLSPGGAAVEHELFGGKQGQVELTRLRDLARTHRGSFTLILSFPLADGHEQPAGTASEAAALSALGLGPDEGCATRASWTRLAVSRVSP